MDQVLGAISSVPVDGDLGELKAFLVKNVRLIESNANNITAILGALQLDVNTFGACFLLATSLRVNTFPTTFDSVVRKLITEGDTSQIREGPSYCQFFHHLCPRPRPPLLPPPPPKKKKKNTTRFSRLSGFLPDFPLFS